MLMYMQKVMVVTSMGMIGYAMSHAEKHERSEGIATLEKREDVNGH